jgi:hypothetical protein
LRANCSRIRSIQNTRGALDMKYMENQLRSLLDGGEGYVFYNERK